MSFDQATRRNMQENVFIQTLEEWAYARVEKEIRVRKIRWTQDMLVGRKLDE